MAIELQNPGFEGTFYKFNGIGELIVSTGWKPWFSEEGGHHRPEYRAETLTTGRAHVRTGSRAQKQFTTFSTHDGGIYQRIEGVTPGQWYTFSAWVWVWSTDSRDNPPTSTGDTGKYSALVGINPWGDERPLYRTTVWGKEALAVYDQWVQVSVTAQAWSNAIVVCTRGNPEWPVKANDSYWDDAELTLADFATPEPPPVEPPVEPPPVGADVDYARIRADFAEVLAEWDRR